MSHHSWEHHYVKLQERMDLALDRAVPPRGDTRGVPHDWHTSWGPPLLVSTPLAAALLLHPITTTIFEQAKACSQDPPPTLANPAATTLHEGDPFLLTLMTLAKALYTHAMGEAEWMIELVPKELRMAAILVVQKYTISIPHAHAPGTAPDPLRAAHALHLPVLNRLATSSHGPEDDPVNMYPTCTSCIGHPLGIRRAGPAHLPRPRHPCPPAPPTPTPAAFSSCAPTPPTLASACTPPPPAPPSTSPPPSLPQSMPAVCDQGQPTQVIPPVHRPLCLRVAGMLGTGRFVPQCAGSSSLVIAALTQPSIMMTVVRKR
ncbi:hypothetical protein JB92DRAFT_3150631 [Gautieria morchelliformis]|nr:hypothetical protein JB92DRAFT_3150631 [Gautieria morchelliformis]